MDRRRFVPSPEGLEGRALLATSFFGTSSKNNNPNADVPFAFFVKEHRVERLPHYLELIKSGRFLSPTTVKQLQADLMTITTELQAPGKAVLNGFNARLRALDAANSLSVANALDLNHSFGVVLKAAGATPAAEQALLNDMNNLARDDATGPQGNFLATNDYTLVLETILGIGRPIRRPTSAQLAIHNGTRVHLHFGVSPKSQPTIVGSYDANNLIQVVDTSGNVVGSTWVRRSGTGAIQSNGDALDTAKYAVTINTPLSNGVHTFYVFATDPFGHVSHISPAFKIKVNTNLIKNVKTTAVVPGGPLAV